MKISIKIQLQIVIFVFLFFLTDSTAIAKGKQTIEIPDVMRIPDGYFDPHIKVCETAQTSKCKTFRPDDCYYIFPTHVKVQQAFCIDSCFNSDGKCENDSSSTTETENHKIPCLCAKQATSCGVLDIGKIKLGCIRIPNPPPPPIFYEKFPENPIIGIVPVSTQNDNSFSTPKIGAKIVGSSTSYDILDGNRTEIQNIQYGKTNFPSR